MDWQDTLKMAVNASSLYYDAADNVTQQVIDSLKAHTSQLDWCEPNFLVSEYVAEFWNTLTHVIFLPIALIEMYLYQDYARLVPNCESVNVIWMMSFLLGVGGMQFHSMLSFFGQMVDEIGILFNVMAAVALFLPDEYILPCFKASRQLWQQFITVLTILFTAIGFVKPAINHVVLFMFSIPCVTIIIRERKKHSQSIVYLRISNETLATFLLAVLCWMSDKFQCEFWTTLKFPYLHAIWHVLSAVSTYQAIVMMSYSYAISTVPELRPVICSLPADNWHVKLLYVGFENPDDKNHSNLDKKNVTNPSEKHFENAVVGTSNSDD